MFFLSSPELRQLPAAQSLSQCVVAPSGRRPRGYTDDYQVCVIVVTIRR